MAIFRIADGKIAGAWEVYGEAGMWRLGVSSRSHPRVGARMGTEWQPARQNGPQPRARGA